MAIVAAAVLAAPLALFLRIRLPSIVLEIALGIVIGPQVLGWVSIDTPIQVMSLLRSARSMASWPCSTISAGVGPGRSANSTALRLDRKPSVGSTRAHSAGRHSTRQPGPRRENGHGGPDSVRQPAGAVSANLARPRSARCRRAKSGETEQNSRHWLICLIEVEAPSPTTTGVPDLAWRDPVEIRCCRSTRDDSRVTAEDPSLAQPCRPTLVMSCRARTRHTYNGTRGDGRMVW